MTAKILAGFLTMLGLPMAAAAALAVLLVEGVPLGLSELSRKTGYAKSHLSQYLRTLASHGLVRIERRGKRYYYIASINGLIKYVDRRIEELGDNISAISNYLRDVNASQLLRDLSSQLKNLSSRGVGR